MQISLISTLKPFSPQNHVDWHQQTALFSWSLLKELEIVIVGADDQTGLDLIGHYGFRHVPEVLRAYDVGYFSKAPIITDMIARALEATSSEWLLLANADLVLLPDFPARVRALLEQIDLSNNPRPFITVRRRDYNLTQPLLTETEILALPSSDARLHKTTGSDIFLTTRDYWRRILEVMPPFIYGRFSWDVWFHRHAVLDASLPVDASCSLACYHPYHGSPVDRSNPEIYHNLMMYDALYDDEVFLLSDPRWVQM